MTTQFLKESKYKDWAYARTDTSAHTTGTPAPTLHGVSPPNNYIQHYTGPNALTNIYTSTTSKSTSKTHQTQVTSIRLHHKTPSELHHSITLSLNFTHIKVTLNNLNSKHHMVSDANQTTAHSVLHPKKLIYFKTTRPEL